MIDRFVPAHDGVQLAVRDHGGSGPDVVFVHGVSRTLEDWAPVLGRLSGVRAVAFDLRSHGRSDLDEDATWADLARDIGTVADRLGLRNPYVVGHSFGGVLALTYAATHPECPGVLDIDGFDFRQRQLLDSVDPAAVDAFLAEFAAIVAGLPSGGGGEEWLAEQRAGLRGLNEAWQVSDDVAAANDARVFVRTADGWERRPPHANRFFAVVADAGDAADPLALLRRIAGRAFFVACRPPGEEGLFATARAGLERHVAAIAAERPNVRLSTIAATHGVIYSHPAEIAALVRELLAPGGGQAPAVLR